MTENVRTTVSRDKLEINLSQNLSHSFGCNETPTQQVRAMSAFTKSGRPDSNRRPPEPHSGALPDCATSRCVHTTTT